MSLAGLYRGVFDLPAASQPSRHFLAHAERCDLIAHCEAREGRRCGATGKLLAFGKNSISGPKVGKGERK